MTSSDQIVTSNRTSQRPLLFWNLRSSQTSCRTSSSVVESQEVVRRLIQKRKEHQNAAESLYNKLKKKHKKRAILPKNLMVEYSYAMNKLHDACNRNDLTKISKLLSSRRQKKKLLKIVMQKDSDERTPLHYAVTNSDVSIKVVSKLIEIGGRDLVLARDFYGENAAHVAIASNVSLEVITKLIEVGGREVLLAKDNQGETSLHKSTTGEHSSSVLELISKLVEVGGMKLVMEKDNKGRTALHKSVCSNSNSNASVQVVSKLIEIGSSKKLLMEKDYKGRTALHMHLKRGVASVAVVSALVKAGGRDIVTEKDNDSGKIALHHHICNCSFFEGLSEGTIKILLQNGIDGQIGGEFGIGGLFVSSSEKNVQNQIYDVWEDISPTIAKVVPFLVDGGRLPILHAAIIAKASPSILKDIIKRFDCITVKDSMNRYPIDIALKSKMKWRDGMKDIIDAMAIKQGRSNVHVAAHYGLQWRNHMKKLLKSSFKQEDDTLNKEQDPMTGLSLFMLCAVGQKSNLNSTYISLRRSPKDIIVVKPEKNSFDMNLTFPQLLTC